MKITESNDCRFATVEGYECRLTTRSRVKNKREILSRRNLVCVDEYGVYRYMDGFALGAGAILIPQKVEKITKIMKKKGYTEFDFDSSIQPLVKCYR